MMIDFIIPGEPVGKGRPRFSKNGHTYTPERTVLYENLVKLMYEQQCEGQMFPEKVPLRMVLLAVYGIPKSTSKKKRAEMLSLKLRPLKKPDSSNVLKAVEDALNKVAYRDDSQVVDTWICRIYGERPMVHVWIQEIEDDEESK